MRRSLIRLLLAWTCLSLFVETLVAAEDRVVAPEARKLFPQSTDGSEWLVIACNPHNRGVQEVCLRCPDSGAPISFALIGDYPAIKRYSIEP